MRIAIDTNRYADLANDQPDVVQYIKQADEILVPFCVVGELRAGFIGGNRAALNDSHLRRFLSQRHVTVLYPDHATVDHWAYIRATLIARKRILPHNDIWIGSLCIQYACVLYSRDEHFRLIDGLHIAT